MLPFLFFVYLNVPILAFELALEQTNIVFLARVALRSTLPTQLVNLAESYRLTELFDGYLLVRRIHG